MHFVKEVMIGEQYKIKGIAQSETIRLERDLWTFIMRGLRVEKNQFKPLSLEKYREPIKDLLMWGGIKSTVKLPKKFFVYLRAAIY